jgi:hypothetical protein
MENWMYRVGGPLGVTVIAVVVALVALLAILHFGFRVFRRRKGKGRAKSGVTSDSRVEVLETTVIDEERKLVLIRCDRIEHLIMIGGAADLVVENDVRKVRGPGAPAAKVPGIDTEKTERRVPAIQRSSPPSGASALDAPKTPEPVRAAPRSPSDVRQPPAAARNIPPIQPAPTRSVARNGAEAPAVPPIRADEGRGVQQRPQPVDSKSTRRDIPPARRTPASVPAPVVGRPGEPLRAAPMSAANDRHARPVKAPARSEPSPGLPAAQIPWSDPDSIENEIVRALKFDPTTRTDQAPGRRETAMPKPITDSSPTLGDLADKLEEALAREVQSAAQPHRAVPDAPDFGFESEATPAPAERTKLAPTQKDRSEKRERVELPRAAKLAPTPEVEPPVQPERREEAPVISLNSRRRESADQLEDEMARLLGELTSDTKGR